MKTKTIPCHVCHGRGFIGKCSENGSWSKSCEYCHGTGTEEVPITNADRIRVMQTSELAKLFTDAVACGCPPDMEWDCEKDEEGWDGCDACWGKWLQQPAKEG